MPPSRYPSFVPLRTTRFSATYISADGAQFLKAYRGVSPGERRLREVQAATVAPALGIHVPHVIATAAGTSATWTAFRRLSGTPGACRSPVAVAEFVDRVGVLRRSLAAAAGPGGSGPGWMEEHGAARVHSTFLLSQLSSKARRRPWWGMLAAELTPVDSHPGAYLHGDMKPEHFLAGSGRVAVVDWEACARGPAAVDFADAAFHAVRDLVYAATEASEIPFPLLARLPFTNSVLAWRLALWLDRRRPGDLQRLTARDLLSIVRARDAETALYGATNIVTCARDAGVPR